MQTEQTEEVTKVQKLPATLNLSLLGSLQRVVQVLFYVSHCVFLSQSRK